MFLCQWFILSSREFKCPLLQRSSSKETLQLIRSNTLTTYRNTNVAILRNAVNYSTLNLILIKQYWTKMQNALENYIRKSINACQSVIMLWRSNIEDVYTKNKNGPPPPQRSTYLSHFWMVFIIYNVFFAVANFTTILKVISDCLMLQNTEKRSLFLHAYIQIVKKPPIF